MNDLRKYIANLTGILVPHYDHKVCPAHDLSHSKEMIQLGRKIKAIPAYKTLDPDEFEVACIMHSTDRSITLREIIGFKKGMPFGEFKTTWSNYLKTLLNNSPFDDVARERIIDAILQHSKKYDDPGDSVLLTALRIADKVVRFNSIGIMAIAANHRDNQFYDENNPFNYDSTEETKLKSVYNDFCRVLEWYGLLPSDATRNLIPLEKLKRYVQFMRWAGEDIAEITGKINEVENNIEKAMGPYYYLVKRD
jgi:hypothetical protein